MKKKLKSIKVIFKKLGAPLVLILGLILGFVADRVTHLLSANSHRSFSHRSVKADLPTPVVTPCHQAAEHHFSPVKKVAQLKHRHKAKHVAKSHHKHAKAHKIASAKKHKGKKSLRVASSK